MEITKKYANSDSPYKERIKQNDEEIAAIQYFGKKNMNIMKIGLDAIDGDENGNKVKNIHNVPRKIRNIPDFIVIKEDKSIKDKYIISILRAYDLIKELVYVVK